MKLKLLSLIITNFKGIRELTIEMDGRNANIYGANGVGKSSIFDAWTWLLFDKDSAGKTDFEIKTLEENGEAIHGLEHTVSAKIVIEKYMKIDESLRNGYPESKEIILKKTLTEKWTKKRGEADQVFTGHETQYWIGELPTTKREYDSYISLLVSENIFRIVSHPAHFNSMKWQDRRKMLFEISGEFDEKNIFDKFPELKEIEEEIKEHGTDDLKKIVNANKSRINKAIKDIPVRIDELNKSIPETSEDFEALECDKEAFENQIKGIDKKIDGQEQERLSIDTRIRENQKKKNALEDLKRKIEAEASKHINDLRSKLQETNMGISSKKNDFERIKYKIESDKKQTQILQTELKELSDSWDKENAKQFVEPSREDFVCPTCKQHLPIDDIENKIEEMKSNFSANKKKNTGNITEKGKAKKAEKLKYEELIKENEAVINKILSEIDTLEIKLDGIKGAIAEEEKRDKCAIDYEKNDEYKKLYQDIKNFESNTFDNSKIKELQEEKTRVRSYILEIDEKLKSRTVVANNKKRIEELEGEERKLSVELCKVEKKEFLIEKYIKAKADLISERINSKFQFVKFKLFDVQVNGGLDETCETTINGVPYSTNLNTAGKVQAGIDIINTFSKYYDIEVPIFIDGRESVIDIPELGAQTINLFVSKEDRKIRMEVI